MKCLSPEEKISYIEYLHITDLVMLAENTQLSLTVKWTVVNNPLDPITHCNIYATSVLSKSNEMKTDIWKGDCVYFGQAYTNCFRLHHIHVLSKNLTTQPFGVEVRVQSVTYARRKLDVDECDSITMWLKP